MIPYQSENKRNEAFIMAANLYQHALKYEPDEATTESLLDGLKLCVLDHVKQMQSEGDFKARLLLSCGVLLTGVCPSGTKEKECKC